MRIVSVCYDMLLYFEAVNVNPSSSVASIIIIIIIMVIFKCYFSGELIALI